MKTIEIPHLLREKIILGENTFLQNAESIQERYGIVLKTSVETNKFFRYHFSQLETTPAALSSGLLRRELGKYPPVYIQSCQVENIYLAQQLFEYNFFHAKWREIGGVYFPNNNIIVKGIPELLEGIVDHEFMHAADKHMRSVIPDENTTIGKGCKWEDLNEKGNTIYIGSDNYYAMPFYQQYETKVPGFACMYGKIDEGEDRATIAELLMSTPVVAFKKAKKDAVFGAKLQRVMFLFKDRSDGLMNEEYFHDLYYGRVNEKYWDKRLAQPGRVTTLFQQQY